MQTTVPIKSPPLNDPSRKREVELTSFLELVGNNVQQLRTKKNISRRVLSKRSRISERYLAQIETGKGNISVGLLFKIAKALDINVDRLVANEDPHSREMAVIQSLLNEATPEQHARVLDILQAGQLCPTRANRIALIGLRGAGKSTLSKLVAEKLGVPYIELNDEIEKTSGMPVKEVFALYGQEGYRRLERRSLERIAEQDTRLILAVAGGIVTDAETYDFLLTNFHTVWLQARPEDHMARVRGQGDERPMLGHPDAMEDLRNILNMRETQYSRSSAALNTSGSTLDESAAALLEIIEENNFLDGQE